MKPFVLIPMASSTAAWISMLLWLNKGNTFALLFSIFMVLFAGLMWAMLMQIVVDDEY